MSEGELKKRIRESGKELETAILWLEGYGDTHGTYVTHKEAYDKMRTKEQEILDEAKHRLEAIIAEIDKNATEDTLFERIVLHRLQTYSDTYFGTNLLDEALKKCAENRGELK